MLDRSTGELLPEPRITRERVSGAFSFVPRPGWTAALLPCGKCHGCLRAESRILAIRAYHESTLHEQNSFLTLTYSDENLPADGKVSLRHMQLFWKRLRKRKDIPKIRYLCCGEYGDLYGRPHYHALVFGADFMDSRATKWSDDQYLHPILQDAWGLGMVTHAPLNFSRCAYVAGYVTKKIGCPDVFRKMSTGRGDARGLGYGWLRKYAASARDLGYVVIEGQRLPIPPYYMDKFDFEEVRSAYQKKAVQTAVRSVESGRERSAVVSRAVNAKSKNDQKRGSL